VTTQLSTINYTYRGDGRRDTMSVTGEPVVTYAYDDAGRLTGIIRNVGGTSRTYNLGYDNAGRRTSLQIPLANGTDYVASSYGYDNANRPTNLLLQGAASIIDNLSYSYDPNGNRNTFGRIAGQTLSPSVANTNYDAANEMLGYNSNNLAYDANGNLQTRTDSCGTTTYTWDARNRLTGISGYKPDCSALTASFAYDSLNRRISKTVNGTTTQYVYDDQDIIQEITGGVTTSYIRPLNIDDPLTRTNSTVTRHYVRDALGSIVALVDDTGATKTTYVYDAFGNVATSGENSDNPFQYTGRENDGTGLYYYRARYYSPEMQRFISEDPIRLAGGGLNYYAYVQNNPVNWIDPLGLWTANIGISGSINIPIIGPVGVGGQGFAGIAYDGTHWAWYWGGGGGVGGGAGGSLGIQFGGSNAKSVCDLRGPFGFASASGGGGLIIGGEGYKGSGSNGQSVTGGNFFIGGGTPGVSGTGGVTYTWVKPW
jgi:RHS repeat-associated protein